jgi:hypothetical protein
MTRVKKFGKPHSVRFPKDIDVKLVQYCKEKGINESDVLQECGKCFFGQLKCKARIKLDKGDK